MKKDFRINKNKKKQPGGKGFCICLLLVLIMVQTLINSGIASTPDPLQPQIASKVLRFHIRANSDSEEDQRVKLYVRDEIGGLMKGRLKDAKDKAQTMEIVRDSIPEIEATAQKALEEKGYDYPVTATIGKSQFPVKSYGPFTFPAGEYDALEVELGEGAGHNWWCVLFPSICFSGSTYEVDEEGAEESLREVLSPEEFADVFSSEQLDIRFKFLEYFK